MKVSELREILNNTPKDYGNLQVRVYADHSQQAMLASGAEKGFIEEDAYAADVQDEDDTDEDSVEVFIIQ